MRLLTKSLLVASVAAVSFGTAAFAASFKESCAAGSGGLFGEMECSCFEKNVTDATEKKDLLAYFEINAQIMQGKAPTTQAASDSLMKGTKLIEKHLPACMG